MSALSQDQGFDGGRLELGLLERSALLEVLSRALAGAVGRDGRGRMILLGAEAGGGKTALVRSFCAQAEIGRLLWGSCERLFMPRALGPFLDISEALGGELVDVTTGGRKPYELVVALVDRLRGAVPSVLVVEDIHWADESTLDALKLLARRIEELPALALVTFRDDQLGPFDQLQTVLGELGRMPGVERHRIPSLSLAAVRTLAEPSGADAERLFEKTSGNPFFVTEALASMDREVPDSVRDAVLARAAQLAPEPRRLLEAAAVVPSKVELWLLETIAGSDFAQLDACLGSGMLRHENRAVTFRHELARLAIEDAIAPHRRAELHRAVLAALSDAPPAPVDPARLSHHADAAGDADAVLRYAPLAGERAAALCAHRQSAEQFASALRYASGLAPTRRAYLLERRSYESYLTGHVDDAAQARRQALNLHRQTGDRVRQGDSHRWLSRLAWFAGDNATALEESRVALELLVSEPPGRELAMAYSNASQLCMLHGDVPGTLDFGGKAIELAERLGDTECLAHALNNVGTAELTNGSQSGVAKLERSLDLSLEADLEEHVARAYTNLGTSSVRRRWHELADRNLVAGMAYCEEHDLDSWRLYMLGWQARSQLDRGRWDAAADDAATVLREPLAPVPARITPLVVIGRLRARRGDPAPWAVLDEALELARGTGELQRLSPVASARAEARWLDSDQAAVAAETDEAVALAEDRWDEWELGELCSWRRRAGLVDDVDPQRVAAPFTLELRGEWRAAAECWARLGCPYEAALALIEDDAVDSLRDALATFQRLGALPASRITAQRLRQRGATGIGRGPRRSTIENPGQLTARQLEILRLVGERLTNAEIAARLYISPRTVDHHVSAILGKLGVQSRQQAAAEARKLGLSET